jgi:hypothetical protein
MGSLASCSDGWLHRCNDFLRGTTNPAVVLRDARAVEPEADASDVGPTDDRMHSLRRIGNPCLSGLREMRLEHSAGFCAH